MKLPPGEVVGEGSQGRRGRQTGGRGRAEAGGGPFRVRGDEGRFGVRGDRR
ncbi:hypothetical protein ABZY36_18400 [Streptomyces sp. NPDC006627]|uniref:hypothetical protein n=1 Tax=Streptomyces sp. NPDC006627 TaxID=3154679 RepID=UPI0033A64A9C